MRDRDLLMMQVHAQSATAVPQVREALQRGLGMLTTVVRERSGADGLDQTWALTLTAGLTRVGQDR